MTSRPLYLETLEREFALKKAKNPLYSLRAFARFLKIDHGVLSMILAGKRVPSIQFAERIPDLLVMSSGQAEAFKRSVAETRRQTKLRRLNQEFESQHSLGKTPAHEVSIESFEEISPWYHSAILEMTFIEGFKATSESIAARLGLPLDEVRLAIDRLTARGLLQTSGGSLVKRDSLVATGQRERTSKGLIERQRKILELSIGALGSVPIRQRSHTAMTMAIDPEKLPEAKRLIEEFSRSLCTFLETGTRQRVYELTVSLFPLEQTSLPEQERLHESAKL